MAILAECAFCHNKQSVKNKVCKCGADIDKQKRSKKVRYWIDFRVPGGKPRREPIGYSIQEARDADGKRRVQKRENRIFDMLPASNMTFDELKKWYLELKSVKGLKSYRRIESALANFVVEFGNRIIGTLKPVELENYQEKRTGEGAAPATIDMEISIAKTMITKAFDNDMVDGRILKAFRSVKRKLRHGSNARKRIVRVDEYQRLIDKAAQHLKPIIITAFNTGMRMGEILNLKWSQVDRKAGFIRLPAESTKEKKDKTIPINHHVETLLNDLPRALRHNNVFTYRGNSIQECGIKRSFRTACRDAKVPYGRKTENGITFHDIRRTVKTNMLNAGIDKAYRDTILGHSLKGMDVHYIAPDESDLKRAMDSFTEWLDGELQLSSVDQTLDQKEKQVKS